MAADGIADSQPSTADRRRFGIGNGQVGTSDAELMRLIHDEHASALRLYVVKLTDGDWARAQDVVQETLLRAWRKPDILRAPPPAVRSWLFTVAKRIVIDQWRATRRRPEVVTDDLPELAVADSTGVADDRRLVVQALGRMTQDHRQVLLECLIRGSTVEQAASTLGIPPGTVKSRTHYALRAFKTALEQVGGTS